MMNPPSVAQTMLKFVSARIGMFVVFALFSRGGTISVPTSLFPEGNIADVVQLHLSLGEEDLKCIIG